MAKHLSNGKAHNFLYDSVDWTSLSLLNLPEKHNGSRYGPLPDLVILDSCIAKITRATVALRLRGLVVCNFKIMVHGPDI